MSQPAPTAPSGAVTAVAILDFAFGALWLLCGVIITFAGGMMAQFLPQIMEQAAKDPNMTEEQRQQMQQFQDVGAGTVGGIVLVIGVITMLIGIPTIVAGVGVMKRRSWGRILTIVIGVIAAVIGVLNLVQLNICGVIIYGAYAGVVLAILFNPRYAAEFQ
jgi:hypothetical protein